MCVCLYVCMYVFINLCMYLFTFFKLLICFYILYELYIHTCVCMCACTHLDTPRREKMKWDEMSRHMWLPCIQHDLANLPGHVPQSLTVIILASPGLGAAGNLRGRKRSTRRRKSLRWLSLSCKLALSAAVNHMNVSECCNAKFSDMMISYDLVW